MVSPDQDEKLDHDSQMTDNLVKAVDPDRDFMKAEDLCVRCHGPRVICDREDCPQKSAA